MPSARIDEECAWQYIYAKRKDGKVWRRVAEAAFPARWAAAHDKEPLDKKAASELKVNHYSSSSYAPLWPCLPPFSQVQSPQATYLVSGFCVQQKMTEEKVLEKVDSLRNAECTAHIPSSSQAAHYSLCRAIWIYVRPVSDYLPRTSMTDDA